MKISPYNYNYIQPYQPQNNVNFKALNTKCSVPGAFGFNVTSFFREPDVLEKAADYLTKTFAGKKTTILNYACSDGSEPWSLLTYLSQRNKNHDFQIVGLDYDPQVIERAKAGIYDICGKKEDIVFAEVSTLRKKRLALRSAFNSYFLVTHRNTGRLNAQVIANVRPEAKKLIHFMEAPAGNIFDVDKSRQGEKVSAILARNMLYFFFNKVEGKQLFFDEQNARKLIPLMHSRLEKDGIVVLGKLENDHYYKVNGVTTTPLEKLFKEYGFIPEHKGNALHVNDPSGVTLIWRKV